MMNKAKAALRWCNQVLHGLSNLGLLWVLPATENPLSAQGKKVRGGVGVSGLASDSPVAIYSQTPRKKNRSPSANCKKNFPARCEILQASNHQTGGRA